MAEAGQLAVHPAVSPGRVLPGQPQHQITDLLASRRAARPGRVGPLAGNQTAVPGQQSPRRHQPTSSQRCREQPGQCRQDRPVGPVRLGPGHLAAEHHHLLAQRQDLRVLGRLTAAQQDQPANDPDHDQVQQTERHGPRSCLNSPTDTNRNSKPMCPVLKRYRPDPQPDRTRRAAARRPPHLGHQPSPARELPAPPAPRRAGHRPARHPRRAPPQAPLPRHRPQQRLAQAPHHRPQPAQPHQPWPDPPQRGMGAHLTGKATKTRPLAATPSRLPGWQRGNSDHVAGPPRPGLPPHRRSLSALFPPQTPFVQRAPSGA